MKTFIPKRSIAAAISILFFIAACNNSGTHAGVDSAIVDKPVDTVGQNTNLIKELQKLKKAIASRDRHQIAAIFQFPIADSIMTVFVEDSNYRKEMKAGGDQLTEALFLKYFDKVSRDWNLDEFDKLFKYLDLSKLRQTNKLEYNAIKETEPCFNQYHLEYEDSIVNISYGINSNKDYVAKTKKEKDAQENDSSVCEHDTIWSFVFNGRSLRLIKQTAVD